MDAFPSIADIKRISEENLLFTSEARLILDEECNCKKCSQGIVIMRQKNNQTIWTFSCDCANGRAQYSYALFGYKMKMAKWKRDPTKDKPHFMAPPISWGILNQYISDSVGSPFSENKNHEPSIVDYVLKA